MDIAALLNDKGIKALEKRRLISEAIKAGDLSIAEIAALPLDDKKACVILEAMEAISRENPDCADVGWLSYAEQYILSPSNSLKREASRVIGNIAHLYPASLDEAVNKLVENTKNDGTVVRWGSAYALGRIVWIPRFADSSLYDTVTELAEQEAENGVKNQYLAGLKKAKKMRSE